MIENDAEEIHTLIIERDEVGDDNSESLTHHIFSRACKKANALGKERLKLKDVRLNQVSRDIWEIEFTCEKNWF